MTRSHSPRTLRGIGVLAFFFAALLLQGLAPTSTLAADSKSKDVPKQGESGGKHDGEPCDDKGGDPQTGGQGYCYKHRYKTWTGDAQNFPNCTAGYVCNSPGAACTDAANNSGHCTMSPNSGTCDCKCL